MNKKKKIIGLKKEILFSPIVKDEFVHLSPSMMEQLEVMENDKIWINTLLKKVRTMERIPKNGEQIILSSTYKEKLPEKFEMRKYED